MENNWCIKLNDENKDVVIGYFEKQYVVKYRGTIGNYYGFLVFENNCYVSDNPFGIEITTEQFIEKIKSEGYNVDYNQSLNKYYLVTQGYKSEILSTSTNNPPINKFLSELDKDTKEVQSDGGSTQYYQIEITNSKGEKFNCELNDILRDVFNNQWDLCNIVKASRRISESRKGQGKKDVSIKYDANKIIWFAEEIKKFNK